MLYYSSRRVVSSGTRTATIYRIVSSRGSQSINIRLRILHINLHLGEAYLFVRVGLYDPGPGASERSSRPININTTLRKEGTSLGATH